MSDNEAKAARPEDYVRRMIEDLKDPEIALRTEKQFSSTSWGDAGKAAILAALARSVILDQMIAKLR